MNCSEIKYYLSDYSRGILLDEIRVEIHEHLNSCNNCAKLYDELITLRSKVGLKTGIVKPQRKVKVKVYKNVSAKKISSAIFPTISASKKENEYSQAFILRKNNAENQKLLVITGIISAIALGVIFAFMFFDNSPSVFGSVQKVFGFPLINSKIVRDQAILKTGEKLTTDGESRARLQIIGFGEIDIEPQTEIKFIETKSSEYQLVLFKGKISVRTWATPKLFSIETPSASVKDFGSTYYLTVDEKSITKLQVKSGWVLMEANDQKSLLSASSICFADKENGIAVPFSINASDSFKNALRNLSSETRNGDELMIILSESRKEDLNSLFHLLIRSRNEEREKIFDRIKQLFIIPRQITQERILNGDKEMLGRLWTELGLGSISVYQNF